MNDKFDSLMTLICSAVSLADVTDLLKLIVTVIMCLYWLTTLIILIIKKSRDGEVTREEAEEIYQKVDEFENLLKPNQLGKGDDNES